MSFNHHEPDLAVALCPGCGESFAGSNDVVRVTRHSGKSCCYWHPYHRWCIRGALSPVGGWDVCVRCARPLDCARLEDDVRALLDLHQRVHGQRKRDTEFMWRRVISGRAEFDAICRPARAVESDFPNIPPELVHYLRVLFEPLHRACHAEMRERLARRESPTAQPDDAASAAAWIDSPRAANAAAALACDPAAMSLSPTEFAQSLAAQGRIPYSWIDEPERAFARRVTDDCTWCTSVRAPCLLCVDGISLEPIELADALWTREHIAALAVEPARVVTAEALAREAAARFARAGELLASRVAWLTLRREELAHSARHPWHARVAHASELPASGATGSLAAAALDRASPALVGRARAMRRERAASGAPAQDEIRRAEWDLAAEAGLTLPPVVEHGPDDDRRLTQLPAGLAGRPFRAVPNPFDPLVDLWRLGFGVGPLTSAALVLVSATA